MFRRYSKSASLAILSLVAASCLQAAEFHVRGDCRSEGGLILLGDVAEVYANDNDQAKALAAIDLFPAPSIGQKRYLRLRELQDLLSLRGINLAEHRFSGAAQTVILGAVEPAKQAPATVAKAIARTAREVNASLQQALHLYLERQDPAAVDWQIKFDLNDDVLDQLAAVAAGSWTISGGTAPWTGQQSFVVGLKLPAGETRAIVPVQVIPPPMLVVATHSLGRGATVHASDVRLQPGQPSEGQIRVFQSLDEVIGMEVTRQVADGQILDDQSLRPQVLVRRGEIVSIYARTAGIQVRVSGRALEDGSQGDLITVESLAADRPATRTTFFARVSGPQTADVYAHAMAAGEDLAGRPANAARLATLRPHQPSSPGAHSSPAVPVSHQAR